jgi:hypothetical protein
MTGRRKRGGMHRRPWLLRRTGEARGAEPDTDG